MDVSLMAQFKELQDENRRLDVVSQHVVPFKAEASDRRAVFGG